MGSWRNPPAARLKRRSPGRLAQEGIEMGECGLVDRVVAGGGGVLAVGGFKLDRAEVDEVGLRVLAAGAPRQ